MNAEGFNVVEVAAVLQQQATKQAADGLGAGLPAGCWAIVCFAEQV